MNDRNARLVTAEAVRRGHPDKFCDQIADAILDAHLSYQSIARLETATTFLFLQIALQFAPVTGKQHVVGHRVSLLSTLGNDNQFLRLPPFIIAILPYPFTSIANEQHAQQQHTD